MAKPVNQTSSLGDEKRDVASTDFQEDAPPAVVAAATAHEIAHEVDDGKYSPWTKSMFYLYAVLFVAYCCGALNGYVSLSSQTQLWVGKKLTRKS